MKAVLIPVSYTHLDLTTEDVKYTFERMFTPATGCTNTYMSVSYTHLNTLILLKKYLN